MKIDDGENKKTIVNVQMSEKILFINLLTNAPHSSVVFFQLIHILPYKAMNK